MKSEFTFAMKVPRPMSKQVCVPVKSSRPRQECIMRPRQECEVREGTESVRQCGVVAAPRRPEQRCSTQVTRVTHYTTFYAGKLISIVNRYTNLGCFFFLMYLN